MRIDWSRERALRTVFGRLWSRRTVTWSNRAGVFRIWVFDCCSPCRWPDGPGSSHSGATFPRWCPDDPRLCCLPSDRSFDDDDYGGDCDDDYYDCGDDDDCYYSDWSDAPVAVVVDIEHSADGWGWSTSVGAFVPQSPRWMRWERTRSGARCAARRIGHTWPPTRRVRSQTRAMFGRRGALAIPNTARLEIASRTDAFWTWYAWSGRCLCRLSSFYSTFRWPTAEPTARSCRSMSIVCLARRSICISTNVSFKNKFKFTTSSYLIFSFFTIFIIIFNNLYLPVHKNKYLFFDRNQRLKFLEYFFFLVWLFSSIRWISQIFYST